MFIRSVNCRGCEAQLGTVYEGSIARTSHTDRVVKTFRKKSEYVVWNSNAIVIRKRGDFITFDEIGDLNVFCSKCNTMHGIRKTRGQNFRLFRHKQFDEIMRKRTETSVEVEKIRNLTCFNCEEHLGTVRVVEFNEIPSASLNGGVVVLDDHVEVVRWSPEISLLDYAGRLLPDDTAYYTTNSHPELICPTCAAKYIFHHTAEQAFVLQRADAEVEIVKESSNDEFFADVTHRALTCKTCEKILGDVVRYPRREENSGDWLAGATECADCWGEYCGEYWEKITWEDDAKIFCRGEAIAERTGRAAKQVDLVICPSCDTRHITYGTRKKSCLLRRERITVKWQNEIQASKEEM